MEKRETFRIPNNHFLTPILQDSTSFKKDKISFWGIVLGLTSFFFSYGYLLLFREYLPPQVPLFFSYIWGEKQLGTPIHLHLLLWTGLGVLCVNSFLASKIFSKETFLARTLIWGGATVMFLLSYTTYKIVGLIV